MVLHCTTFRHRYTANGERTISFRGFGGDFYWMSINDSAKTCEARSCARASQLCCAMHDSLNGGTGRDRVLGDSGNDRINIRDGVRRNDRANGGSGFDRRRNDPGDFVTNFEGTF